MADAYRWAILQSKEMIKVKRTEEKRRQEKKKQPFHRALVRGGNGQLIVVKNEADLKRYARN